MHRIFLAPIRSDLDLERAHEHWTTRHGEVFSETPGLRGYVQNRPPRPEWSGRTHVCAEAWFDDRAAEKVAFESDYYRDDVTTDEARFVQRDAAWVASTTMTRSARHPLAYRVLAFGHSEQTAADWLTSWDPDDIDVFALSRPPWTCGQKSALGLWTDDLTRAVDAAVHFGPLSLLAQPVAVVLPPEKPWTTA